MSASDVEWFFYVVVDCPRCDAEIYWGPNLTLHEYRGRPAIPLGFVGAARVRCPSCGVTAYVDEPELWTDDDNESEDDQ